MLGGGAVWTQQPFLPTLWTSKGPKSKQKALRCSQWLCGKSHFHSLPSHGFQKDLFHNEVPQEKCSTHPQGSDRSQRGGVHPSEGLGPDSLLGGWVLQAKGFCRGKRRNPFRTPRETWAPSRVLPDRGGVVASLWQEACGPHEDQPADFLGQRLPP